jgi:hypothetical protein
MKKISLLLTALFALTAGSLFAQTSAEASVTVNAEIAAALEIEVLNNLNFGLLTAQEDGYLSTGAVDEQDSQGIISGQELGEVTISGLDGENINITFPPTVTLVRQGGTTGDDLTYSPSLSFNNGTDQISIVSGNTNIPLAGGSVNVRIGGGVDSNGEAAGTFEGTLTVEAAYLSI